MAKQPSLFEHHHGHDDHDHGHDDHEHEHHHDDIDLAQKSLSDALRVSFGILKFVMLVILVFYCFSGLFNVKSNEVAVRLRFGKMVQDPSANHVKVLQAGGPYFSFPFPIEQVLRVPLSPRKIDIIKPFWWELTGKLAGKTTEEIAQGKQGPLNPERDGSLLTGDANIVHVQWAVTYRVADPVKYLKNIGSLKNADRVVRNLSEQALVTLTAKTRADDIIKGQIHRRLAIAHMQKLFDHIGAGIEIVELSIKRATMPSSVRRAYEAVVLADQEKGQLIEEARRKHATILEGVAGEGCHELLELVDAYELATERSTPQVVAKLSNELKNAYQNLNTGPDRDNKPIGGQVALVMNNAYSYRTQIAEAVKAEAQRFEQLLPEYQKNPNIVRNRLWLDAKEIILTSDSIETFYGNGQIYIETNRRPDITAKREKKRLIRESRKRRNR